MVEATVASFLTFVFESAPDITLNHDEGYDECAIGLYAEHLHEQGLIDDDCSFAVAQQISRDMRSMENIPTYNFEESSSTFDDETLTTALGNPGLMWEHAPNMGRLQKFIRTYYPTLVPV